MTANGFSNYLTRQLPKILSALLNKFSLKVKQQSQKGSITNLALPPNYEKNIFLTCPKRLKTFKFFYKFILYFKRSFLQIGLDYLGHRHAAFATALFERKADFGLKTIHSFSKQVKEIFQKPINLTYYTETNKLCFSPVDLGLIKN